MSCGEKERKKVRERERWGATVKSLKEGADWQEQKGGGDSSRNTD